MNPSTGERIRRVASSAATTTPSPLRSSSFVGPAMAAPQRAVTSAPSVVVRIDWTASLAVSARPVATRPPQTAAKATSQAGSRSK